MTVRHSLATRGERVRAATAAIAVNLFLGIAFVTGLALRSEQRSDDILETFDVSLPPSAPSILEPKASDRPKPEAEGAVGRKTEPSPVVAMPAPIPVATPIIAAPIPGTGNALSTGSADRGTGTGAGGSGSGGGGGGTGAGGIGSEAKLLGGNRARLPSSMLRAIPRPGGYAHLLLTVDAAGRVTGCDVLTSSGFPSIDEALCGVMVRNSRWQPARDRTGQPIAVKVRYTATWNKG